jgi:WD40 repeat protein
MPFGEDLSEREYGEWKANSAQPVLDGPPIPNIKYDLNEPPRKGGFGVVYKATETHLKRIVAVKVVARRLNEADLREAQVLASLPDPHIVTLFRSEQVGDHRCFVLEWVEGGSLRDRLAAARNKPLAAPRDIARMIEIIAGAVGSARIIHRDLKPENILVAAGADDAKWFTKVKVADFGLALPADEVAAQAGRPVGTPGYLPPEHFDNSLGGVDGFSDVYALGIILYECLTGTRPPLVTEACPVQFPKGRSCKAPETLKSICLKCLAYRKDERYYDGTVENERQRPSLRLAKDLEDFREHRETRARPLNPVQRLGLWARRRPSQAAFAATLTLVLLVSSGLAVTLDALGREKDRGDKAARAELKATRAKRIQDYSRYLERAQRHLEAHNSDGALAQLLKCNADLRDWEWYYLRGLCVGSLRAAHFSKPLQSIALEADRGRLGPGRIAVVLESGRIRVRGWEETDWKEADWTAGSPEFHEWPDRSIRQTLFTPGGLLLAGSTVESPGAVHGIIEMHSLHGGQKIEPQVDTFLAKEGEAPIGWTTRMALHPDGRTLVYAAAPRQLAVIDLDHPEAANSFGDGKITLPILGLAFSPDGKFLATVGGSPGGGARKGQVLLWSWPVRELLDHSERDNPLRGVAFAADGRRAAAFDDLQVNLWNVDQGKLALSPLRMPLGNHSAVNGIAFHPRDPKLLATVGRRDVGGQPVAELVLWDLNDVEAKPTPLLGHKMPVSCLCFDPEGNWLVSGDEGGDVTGPAHEKNT